MVSKPAFLGSQHAAAFQDPDVAAAYYTRPPYPDALFELLAELLVDQPRVVLDLGCGTGSIACRLAPIVDRVDAVDFSAPMVEEGRRSPGGDHPALRWIVGRAEDAPLQPPYAMITAGASLHWMDWDIVLPRLGEVLTSRGLLVLVNEGQVPPPWQADLVAIIQRYSANQDFQPGFDLPTELAARGLFQLQGRCKTAPAPFRQPLDTYVESFHARSSLARARMGSDAARRFDAEVRDLVLQHQGSTVELQLVSDVTWGRPSTRG
jgi:ubiquinone/menaquinone biosynthesis C-methylase UbiE